MARGIEYKILFGNQIDKHKWDQKATQWNWNVYSFIFYLDAVTDRQWSAIVFGDYDFIFPFYERKKWGVNYVCMPPYSQKYQMEGFPNEIKKTIFDYFNKKYWLYDIRVDSPPFTSAKNKHLLQKTNFELPLDKDYEILQASYSNRLKRSLKNKEQLILVQNQLEEAILFFERFSFNKNSRKETIAAISRMPRDIVKSIIAKSNDGTTIASLIYIDFRDRIYLILPTSNEIGRKNQAMSILIDALISQHANTSSIIDFEGSSIEKIANFYRQYSPKETHYFYCRKRPLDIIR